MNISINTEQAVLKIFGPFEGVHARFVKVTVTFPLPNQNLFPCTIQHLQNDRFISSNGNDQCIDDFVFSSLTCHLAVPKQPVEGIVSMEIKPRRTLSKGDTDLSGSAEFIDKLTIYVRLSQPACEEGRWFCFRYPNRFFNLIPARWPGEQNFVWRILLSMHRAICSPVWNSIWANSHAISLSKSRLPLQTKLNTSHPLFALPESLLMRLNASIKRVRTLANNSRYALKWIINRGKSIQPTSNAERIRSLPTGIQEHRFSGESGGFSPRTKIHSYPF